MARGGTFHLSVITPERAVMETDARFVALPAHDGEVGILPYRAPLVVKLGIGALRAETAEGRRVLFVDGGFAQVVDNKVTVLTEQARGLDELDPGAARDELEQALTLEIPDEHAYTTRQKALQRARVQLRLTEGRET